MSFKAAPLFDKLKAVIAADANVVSKVKGILVYVISKGSDKKTWTIDLKVGLYDKHSPLLLVSLLQLLWLFSILALR
jgi:hypothetical protein